MATQVANAIGAVATVPAMVKAPDQGWRRARLNALAEHEDFKGRAALGRALGYKDGAYVRQMIEGERAITEKTIAAAEALRGGKFRGWFAKPAPPADFHLSVIDAPGAEPPAPPANFQDRRVASESDWALLDALKWYPQEERDKLVSDITERAAKLRAYVLEHLDKVNGNAKKLRDKS